MEKLGDIISRLLQQDGYGKGSRRGPVFDRWQDIVGEMMAGKCYPLAVRKGVLVVQVNDSVWMHELQMRKPELLERIQRLAGDGGVTDIRWTIRGEMPPRARAKRPAPPPVRTEPLSEEETAWIRAVSAQVEDPGIRGTLERVLGKYLRARNKPQDAP